MAERIGNKKEKGISPLRYVKKEDCNAFLSIILCRSLSFIILSGISQSKHDECNGLQ